MTHPFQNAKCIWCKNLDSLNSYALFSDTLKAESGKHYALYVSADSDYACFVNGRLAGFTQYGDYLAYKSYDTLDITSQLHEGENEILFTVYSMGESFSVYKKEKPFLIFSVYENGMPILASSENTLATPDTRYRMGDMEKLSGQLGFTFSYDSTVKPAVKTHAVLQDTEPNYIPRPVKKTEIHEKKRTSLISQGIFKKGYDDSTCGKAVQHAYLAYVHVKELTGKDAPLYFPTEEGLAFHTDVSDCDGIYILLDLQENSAGYLSFDMDLPQDTQIDIGFGEHLADLRVRAYVGSRNFAATYIGTKGRNRFTHYLKRLGMRYLQLHIHSRDFTLYYAGIHEALYPVRTVSNLETTDKLHNQIYKTCVRTLRNCMHEHYEDCAWREQALYAMDSRNQMLCGYYVFGEYAFAKASLKLMSKSMRDDNMLELCSPSETLFTIPTFSMVYVVALQEYLLHTGDFDFIAEMLPTAKQIMDGFLAQMDKATGLVPRFYIPENWYYYEWETGLSGKEPFPEDKNHKTYDAPLNAFLSIALSAHASLLRDCGKQREAASCLAAKETINTALHRDFYDANEGCYCSFIQGENKKNYAELTQSLLLCCGAVPDSKKQEIYKKLLSHALIPISLSNSIFKYEALLSEGETYAGAVFDEIADIWGKMLYQGATTFWETAKGEADFSGGGSLCHGWSAVPAYFYYKYIAGVRMTENGGEHFILQPLKTAGLHLLHADLPTPNDILSI